MTALKFVEEAEALFKSKGERAAIYAAAALETEDATVHAARPRAHRLLALEAWSKGFYYAARNHFGAVADLLGGQAELSPALLAEAIGDVALVDYQLGEHESALALRRKALELAEEGADASPVLLRQLRRRLAQSLQTAGDHEAAAHQFLACRPEPADGPEEHIGWLNALALLSEQGGRIDEAAGWYGELAAVLSAAEYAEGAVQALGNAALFALECGHVGQAAQFLRTMRRRLRTDRKLASRLAQYDVQILILQSRGRYAAAADVAGCAEKLARFHAPKHPFLASRVATQAACLHAAGREAEALALLEAHAPADAAVTAADTELLVQLAAARHLNGQHAAARHVLILALVEELGLPNPANKFEVLARLCELAADAGLRRASALLGKIALAHLRQMALPLVGGEYGGWLRSRMGLYDRVLTQLALAGRVPEAQALQLRRWQEVSWEFGARANAIADPDAVPFRPGEERLRQSLAGLEAKARAGRPAGQDWAGKAELSEELSRWLDTVWAEGFEDTRPMAAKPRGAPSGAPLVSFLPNGNGFTGVVNREGTQAEFPVGLPADALARAVRELRDALENRESGWRPPSEALHGAIVAPMADALKGASRIDFTAIGIMSFIPFAALSRDGRFLAESADIAVRTGQHPRRPEGISGEFWKAAAFGSSGTGLPLASVPTEVVEVSRRTGGEPFLDRDFTAAALRDALARGVDLLHIAGHFRLEPARPLRSALLLGDGTELTLAALGGAEYDFSSVKLLVLAACETAITDSLDIGIEGLAGLTQNKGAGTVLATLWRVGDAGASHLMRLFYDRLFADQARDPVAALGRAQRAMLQEGRGATGTSRHSGLGASAAMTWHPADWSGFTAYVSAEQAQE